jgi:hypothetical protein
VWKLTLLVALALMAGAAPALADRAPTGSERKAIVRAVRFFPAVGRQNRVTFVKIRVSKVDRSYGLADIFTRDAKGGGIGYATALLRRVGSGWRVIFFGTEIPPCSVAPARVRIDLLKKADCLRGK